jgi:hypothetical protein
MRILAVSTCSSIEEDLEPSFNKVVDHLARAGHEVDWSLIPFSIEQDDVYVQHLGLQFIDVMMSGVGAIDRLIVIGEHVKQFQHPSTIYLESMEELLQSMDHLNAMLR